MEGRHHFTFLVLFLLMNGINGQNNEDNSLDIEYGMTDQPDIEQNVTECPDPVQNFLGYLGERGLKIEAIEGQLAQLQTSNAQMKNHFEAFEGQLTQNDQQINQIQTSNAQMKNHFEAFEGQLAQKDQQINRIQTSNTQMKNQLAQKDQQISQLTNSVNELQALQVPKIIFNSEKTDGGLAFTGKITFNQITLNVGNAMSSDGFVAPIAGHYKMSFSAQGGFEKYGIDTNVSVHKNGSEELWIGDRNNAKESDGNNISHDWIWKLNKGDKVTFRVHSESYLRATRLVPVNFNGELVFVET